MLESTKKLSMEGVDVKTHMIIEVQGLICEFKESFNTLLNAEREAFKWNEMLHRIKTNRQKCTTL